MTFAVRLGLGLLFLAFTACAGTPSPAGEEENGMPLQVTSAAFADGETIPQVHTCDGPDLSPPLRWQGVPAGTQSLALIVDDPDAPGRVWVHWVLYDIPPDLDRLPEGVEKTARVAGVGIQGVTDFRRVGYGGPCPPPGDPHRYFFRLYALDTRLVLPEGASRADVDQAMEGHILAQGVLMGLYGR